MASVTVQPKILRREKAPDEYEIYRAALEWDLIEPIVIQDRSDLKSEEAWKDRIEPFTHQVTNLITFCRRLPVTLLADDVGLGKTISAGLIVRELQSRSRVSRILVVAPKILGPQWKEELESKFGIPAMVVAGRRAKLYDEFTPRLEVIIAGLDGAVRRSVRIEADYRVGDSSGYRSSLHIDPGSRSTLEAPALEQCELTRREYPEDAIASCTMTGTRALKHLLATSQLSGRTALPEHGVRCTHTGKLVLSDETERSDITGNLVARGVLLTSDISGMRAEPDRFEKCAFSFARGLTSELSKSEVTGKFYRIDQEGRSDVSGRKGHQSEFEICFETRQSMSSDEAEACEESGKRVRKGILEPCFVSGKRVVPSLLSRCAASGKRALTARMLKSTVSGEPVLSEHAVLSSKGRPCLPSEVQNCRWSGTAAHPDDLEVCRLTSLPVHRSYLNLEGELASLREMLEGVRHTQDAQERWPDIAAALGTVLRGAKCRVETAVLAPSKKLIAMRAEVRTLLGLRVINAGGLYSLESGEIVGRTPLGRATKTGWTA